MGHHIGESRYVGGPLSNFHLLRLLKRNITAPRPNGLDFGLKTENKGAIIVHYILQEKGTDHFLCREAKSLEMTDVRIFLVSHISTVSQAL